MPETSPLIFGLAIALFGAFVVTRVLTAFRNAGQPPLPPGPKGLPLVGNLKDMPQPGELEFRHWLKHKELYGPISSLTVMGQTIIIVNDLEVASEILEKRSVKHSSRPKSTFAGEIVGWEHSLALLPYGDRFRTYRRHMSRVIGSKAVAAKYDKLQEAEAGYLLLNILDKPDSIIDHIKREAGSVILKVSYGYNSEPHQNDYLIDLVGETLEQLNLAAAQGALVDAFPFLRFLPEWFPGTGWKQAGKEWRATLEMTANKPFDFVKHQMSRGKDTSSFVSHLLSSGDLTEEEESTVKWSALSMYAAGAETTVSSIACFFLLMAIHPEIQRKAQEEIDRVVGQDRLPSPSDRPNLPYVEAIVKELLRWHPVAPMGLPHSSSEDDVVEGYVIPKDALIFANLWQVLRSGSHNNGTPLIDSAGRYFTHDPKVYPEPMEFRPERFLASEGQGEPAPDPHKLVFGLGRRICPGRVIADNALFITFAQALAAFSLSNGVVDGKEVKPMVKLLPGIITHPDHCPITIRPRSAHHEMLIRAVEQTHPRQESDAGALESMGL